MSECVYFPKIGDLNTLLDLIIVAVHCFLRQCPCTVRSTVRQDSPDANVLSLNSVE